MGVASPHAYRRRRRRKRRVNPLTLTLWNRDRGNNFPKEKALLFMVRQKANKLFWGCSPCCWFSAFSFAVCGCGFASSVSLVRRGFLVVAVLLVVLAVPLVCRSVGVAFLFLLCLPFVGRGSSGLSVLPLSVVVRVFSCGCGCGFVPLAPTNNSFCCFGKPKQTETKKPLTSSAC